MERNQNEIDLWFATPDLICPDNCSIALLHPEEKQQYNRYLRPKDQKLYLLSRVMMRSILSQYLPASPAAWVFGREEKGRLTIIQPSLDRTIYFSLSHTDDLVVVAICSDRFIGVDAEKKTRDQSILDVESRVLTVNEISFLDACDPSRRIFQFLRFWTLKEALSKALSLGMSMPFEQIEFNLKTAQIYFETLNDDELNDANWQFQEPKISDDHIVSLAFIGEHDVRKINWTTGLLKP